MRVACPAVLFAMRTIRRKAGDKVTAIRLERCRLELVKKFVVAGKLARLSKRRINAHSKEIGRLRSMTQTENLNVLVTVICKARFKESSSSPLQK